MLIRLQPSVYNRLVCLFPTLSSPWRRVPVLSVTESGRLSAATDSRSLSSLTTAILETESCESAATETEQKRRTRGQGELAFMRNVVGEQWGKMAGREKELEYGNRRSAGLLDSRSACRHETGQMVHDLTWNKATEYYESFKIISLHFI